MVAGGLGPVPHQAQLLEEFTPADELLATVGAIVRVFDRFGNRENRSRARMKFVMAEFGLEKFRAQVFKERTSLKVTMGGKIPPIVVREEGPPSRDRSLNRTPDLLDPAYQLWRRSNVRPQKQPGYVMVTVRLELGDFTPLQLACWPSAPASLVTARSGSRTSKTSSSDGFPTVRWRHCTGSWAVWTWREAAATV